MSSPFTPTLAPGVNPPGDHSSPVAVALLRWYDVHQHNRGLPWRDPQEPWVRRCLVEGLLAQTRADAVARHYDAIFRWVHTAADWVLTVRRVERVAPLGYGRAKVTAMDSIAACLLARQVTYADLVSMPGVGPYIAAMVAVLHGETAVPVDCNVDRVARRYGSDDPAGWMRDLVEGAAAAQRYALVSAVLDLGATVCTAAVVDCAICPIEVGCAYPHKRVQLRFF